MVQIPQPPTPSSTFNWVWYRSKYACNAKLTGSHFRINAWLCGISTGQTFGWTPNGAFCVLFSQCLWSVIYAYMHTALPTLTLTAFFFYTGRRGRGEQPTSSVSHQIYRADIASYQNSDPAQLLWSLFEIMNLLQFSRIHFCSAHHWSWKGVQGKISFFHICLGARSGTSVTMTCVSFFSNIQEELWFKAFPL